MRQQHGKCRQCRSALRKQNYVAVTAQNGSDDDWEGPLTQYVGAQAECHLLLSLQKKFPYMVFGITMLKDIRNLEDSIKP